MYLSVENAVVERLRAKLGPDVHVGTMAELERVEQYRQKAPAVWVISDGYTIGASIGNVPNVQQIDLEWFVVCVGKSARGNGGEDDARRQANEIAERCLRALLGFHVGGGKYLRLQDSPGPEYDAGYCHVPLAFSCGATFKGDSD